MAASDVAAIEALRYGVPPLGRVRELTVGRGEQLAELRRTLDHGGFDALLVRANYGAGKGTSCASLRRKHLTAGARWRSSLRTRLGESASIEWTPSSVPFVVPFASHRTSPASRGCSMPSRSEIRPAGRQTSG